MINSKKIITIILIIILFALFSSCEFENIIGNSNPSKTAEKLVEAFDKKDIDAAKGLFSKNTVGNVDLDDQLNRAFELYDSKSISREYKEITGGGHSDYGEYSESESGEMIVKTEGGTYCFSLRTVTDASDPNEIGIKNLVVEKDYNKEKSEHYGDSVFVGVNDLELWLSEDTNITLDINRGETFEPYGKHKIYGGLYETVKRNNDHIWATANKGKLSIYKENDSMAAETLFDETEKSLIIQGNVEDFNSNSFILVVTKVNKKLAYDRKVGDKIFFKMIDELY